MRRWVSVLSMVGLCMLLLAACSEAQKTPPVVKPLTEATTGTALANGKTGKVLETVNSGGYTYVQVDTGTEKIWAAAPEVPVKVGDSVMVPEGTPMQNYESKTLKRKFDLVYFVPFLQVNGQISGHADGAKPPGSTGTWPKGHPPMSDMPGIPSTGGAHKVAVPKNIDLSGIAKADQTVAEIFAQKRDLSGKPVKIRGKVVKFTPEVMGKNWLHIEDGSGQEGANDLTVNTSAEAEVGDTVVVAGKLTVDKDFGFGYKYDVIIEDAQVTKE